MEPADSTLGPRHPVERRTFMAMMAGGLLAAPLAAEAQQKAMPVIGVLNTRWPSPSSGRFMGAFRQGLSEAGFAEGQNVVIEYQRGASGCARAAAAMASSR